MLQKAVPILLPLPPLALMPAALLLRPLLRLLDPGLQILIKLNNLKICQNSFINLHILTKILFLKNAPGDAQREPPQNAPYVRQRVIFGPTQ